MAPSMLGKLKTTIQFVAIALAILRLGDPIGGLYIDQWAMLVAAAITVWSAADYLVRALAGADDRVDGRASSSPAAAGWSAARSPRRWSRAGDEVVALARNDAAADKLHEPRASTASSAATRSTRTRSPTAWTAASSLYHVAGVNTFCAEDPALLLHVNVRGAETAVRAAARAGVAARRAHVRRRLPRRGPGHRRHRELARTAAATCRVYERSKHEGEVAAFAAAKRAGLELVAINPSSRPGPGPRRRHRPDPDRLPQRQAQGLRRHPHQPGRHPTTRVRGAHPRRREGRRRRALPDQRRDDHLARGAGDRRRGRRRQAPRARSSPPRSPRRRPRSSRASSACAASIRRSAAR